MCVCICIYVYIYIHIYICIYVYLLTYIRIYIHVHHTHTHTHIYTGSPEELKNLADAMFFEMDTNKDGHVTFKEYFAVVSRDMPGAKEKDEQVCLCVHMCMSTYIHTQARILYTFAFVFVNP